MFQWNRHSGYLPLNDHSVGRANQVLFDFDGTLADTLDRTLQIINALSQKYGFQNLERESVRTRNLKVLILDLDIGWWQLSRMTFEVKKQMAIDPRSIDIFAGILEVLARLKQIPDLQLGILSSNSTQLVLRFLQEYKIDCFDFIYGGSALFGKHKTILKLSRLRQWSRCLYIGDEARDIEAMKKVDIPVIAVTWGWNCKSLLSQHKPQHLIECPKELASVVERHFC